MPLVSYAIYRGYYDPAPNRGKCPDMVGLTIKETSTLTKRELLALICELQDITDKMGD
jgi:hypothetical protein